MDYRLFGRTGVLVSPLALGTMNFGQPTSAEDSAAIIRRALDAGINFIDTADMYQRGESERIVGQTLKDLGARHNVFLATKGYNRMGDGPNDAGASRYHILRACEDSLRRLQTDYIDLYQLHRPPPDHIPQDETLRALEDLVRSGKVLYIGSSTFPAWKLMESLSISERYGWARYVSEQPPYNLLDRRIENELVPLCQRYGLAILPWSPLAGGILSGRYNEGGAPEGSRAARNGPDSPFAQRVTPKAIEAARRVAELAQAAGLTASQLALLWVKDQPGVTSPIIGPRTREHLADNLAVLELSLSDEQRSALDKVNGPGNAISDFHNSNEWMRARIGA